MTLVTIILTILALLAVQKTAVSLAQRQSDIEWLDGLYDRLYGLCGAMGWAVPQTAPENVSGLDRYNEDGSLPAVCPRITKIVVADEYSRQQVMLAIRYLHDQDIDTGYMAVNDLVHFYTDEDGEPTGVTPWIVVEPYIVAIVGDIETRSGDLVVTRHGDRYTITVAGVVRHPNASADSAIGALCHYLHGAEYSLMKER